MFHATTMQNVLFEFFCLRPPGFSCGPKQEKKAKPKQNQGKPDFVSENFVREESNRHLYHNALLYHLDITPHMALIKPQTTCSLLSIPAMHLLFELCLIQQTAVCLIYRA